MRIPIRQDRRRLGRSLWLCLGVGALGACVGGAPTGGPAPPPRPAPESTAPATDGAANGGSGTTVASAPSTEAIAASVVELALASIGTPYRWGGTGANGFDCSGLIQFAYGEHGVRLPRVSREQIRMGSSVEPLPSHLRPADILGFSRNHGGDISHVGLYVGRGEFIHSSSTGVRVSKLSNPYWQVRLVAVRRVLD